MPLKSQHLHSPGQMYHDFQLIKAIEIPELHCTLRELVHLPTDAKIMHIANDDPENLFCLSFQTLPDSSNGVAHILEHTVLCGSEKYPVKDPFFAMNRRSLNTFMNALTGSDFTCYPAASQVPKDFYNLLEVYLDAVFKPNLNELSFLQEGHRLEFAIPSDPTSALEYKGIVFNEMKGAMASGTARLTEALNHALFPNITYGHNSGGDPKVIPQLTYEELCAFHRKFYHPSRCLFFFYGNIPLERHLDFISQHALKDVEKEPPLPPLTHQPRFNEPLRLEVPYPISAEEEAKDKTLLAFGWLTCDILNQQELLALCILDIILLDTDASPLKMALLKSGYCKQVSSYIDTEITDIPLVIILKGCNPDKAGVIEELIMQTLKEVIKEGLPLHGVENAIHQLEFYRSEITGDHAPFGLSLFMRSALLKQHGADPEAGLKIHSLFDQLRKKNLEDPKYLTKLLDKYLLSNPHFVRIVMPPDTELAAGELAEEQARLSAIRAALSDSEVKQIVHKAAELTAFQKKQEEENPDVLPKVTMEDVPTTSRNYVLNEEKVGNLHVFHHPTFTNEIIYADLIFNLPAIHEEDLSYVRLFTTLMHQMGCGGRDYAENLEYIQANTGSIGAVLAMNLQAADHEHFFPSFAIRGKALHRKANKLFSLIHEMVTSTNFNDIPRLKEVLLKQYTGLQSSLNQNALRYAINLSASQLDPSSRVSNAWNGLDYFWKIQDIAQNFDHQAKQLVEKLQQLQSQILCLENPHLVITCDSVMYDELKRHGFYGLQNIETHAYKPWNDAFTVPKVPSQGRVIASPIAFTGKVFKTISYTHPDAPALNIAAFLFDNLTLHTRLREQGGAYGGGAVCNSLSGNFYFYAYRDPNIASSLNAFEDAIKTVLKGDFDESDLEEAKLEMIQTLDAPISPGSRGDKAYGWLCEGRTLEIRQAFRNRLLTLKKQDVISAVKKHIAPHLAEGATVVFAGKELLEKENDVLKSQGKEPLKIETI